MNRPDYTPVGESSLDEWLTDNLPALVERYQEWIAQPPIAGLFLEFCQSQYEEQKELDDEPLTEMDLRAAEADVEDAWFTEEEQARA